MAGAEPPLEVESANEPDILRAVSDGDGEPPLPASTSAKAEPVGEAPASRAAAASPSGGFRSHEDDASDLQGDAQTERDISGSGSKEENRVAEAANDIIEDGKDYSVARSAKRFLGFFVPTMLCCAFFSAAAVTLWSDIGTGDLVLGWLQENDWLFYPAGGGAFFITLCLLVFDFFAPPHIPGEYMKLWKGDTFVGRSIFGLAVLCLVACCCFMSRSYPSVPLVMTISALPIGLGLVHLGCQSFVVQQQKTPQASLHKAASEVQLKFTRLSVIRRTNLDKFFFISTLTALVLSGVATLCLWFIWVFAAGNDWETVRTATRDTSIRTLQEEELYILWVAPLVVGVSNLVFAFFAGLRVKLHDAYMMTNTDLSQMLEGVDADEVHKEYVKSVHQMSLLLKGMVCTFVTTIGFLYIASQLLYTNSKVAQMAIGTIGLYFLVFLVTVAFSTHGLLEKVKGLKVVTNIVKSTRSLLQDGWVRACILCPVVPFLPFVLALSWVMQKVRKCRGIYQKVALQPAAPTGDAEGRAEEGGDEAGKNEPQPPSDSLSLTPQVYRACVKVAKDDWLAYINRAYILCCIFFSLWACPLFVNVCFAWMIKVINEMVTEGLPFIAVIGMVFVIGVIAFMLPMVPGLSVYLFGGLVLSGTCPQGFWWGAGYNIILGWVLKLFACAIQQKLIGGLLGRSTNIRHMVGVHNLTMRCIEAVMRKPGLSLGKVAILCGGPDWPTSVLAGILNLSLVECEIGTAPIILFVAPCSLSGSFYLKSGESELWSRLANFMVLVSLIIWVALWIIVAWAVQTQLETNRKELTRNLPANVDLVWIDHKEEEVKRRLDVTWSSVPFIVRWTYALGGLSHVLVCQAYGWGYSYLHGTFQVSDDVDGVKFLGESSDALVTNIGLCVLIAYGVGCLPYVLYALWSRAWTRVSYKSICAELDLQETEWKAKWLAKVEQESKAEEPASAWG